MKIKSFILPLLLAISANSAMADYKWYYSPQAIIGPFDSPEDLCNSLGADIKDMNPVYLITWGMVSPGRCNNPGATGFFRIGTGCDSGKEYDNKQMSCEPKEPDKKAEQCNGGISDITGQCNPQANPEPDECNPETQGNPILIATGQKVEITTDIELPNSALKFSRNYWSSRLYADNLGLAWQHNWQMRVEQLQSRNRIKLYRENGRGIIYTPRNGRWESDSSDTEVVTKLPNNQGWKVQLKNGTIELYNSLGQLINYSKKGYPAVTLAYGINGKLTTLAEENGRRLTINYNSNAQISEVTSNAGVAVTYSYDNKNRLVQSIKNAKTKTYHYENNQHPHLLTGITDERGVRYATWSYNGKGQAISSEHAGGVDKYTFEYLPDNKTRVTNPLGKSAVYHFQDIRLEKKIKKIEGEPLNTCIATQSSIDYNAKGLPIYEYTKNGATIKYEYNDRGLQVARNISGGGINYNVYTKWHSTLPLPLEISKGIQKQTFEYDNEGKLIELTDGFKDLSEINKGQDVALLQFNDFTDEAGNSWEKIGNPQIVDDPEAVTGKALYLDGNSYLTTSVDNFQFGTGDFTLEFRFKVNTEQNADVFIDMMNTSSTGSSISIYQAGSQYGGVLVYHAYQSGMTKMTHGYPNINVGDNQWHHAAFVKQNNTITIYIDGVARKTLEDNINYEFNPNDVKLTIGSRNSGADGYSMKGYIDQVRISKKAIYTENFAPSLEPYVLNQDPNELNMEKDLALLQFDNFTDEAGNAWQLQNDPTIVEDQEAITGNALYMDGNSFLTSNVSKYQFGKKDFTIEFWFKVSTRDAANVFIDMMNTSSRGSSLSIYQAEKHYGGVLVYHAYQSGTSTMTHGYPNIDVGDNQWHHAAFVKSNGIVSIYIDGINKKTIKDNISYSFHPEDIKITIGSRNAGKEGINMKGNIDQIRISGKALYTENFTPSREPYVLDNGINK